MLFCFRVPQAEEDVKSRQYAHRLYVWQPITQNSIQPDGYFTNNWLGWVVEPVAQVKAEAIRNPGGIRFDHRAFFCRLSAINSGSGTALKKQNKL
jgi:hypothetical protein